MESTFALDVQVKLEAYTTATKAFFSMVLLAMRNANYRFITFDFRRTEAKTTAVYYLKVSWEKARAD